MQCSVCCTLWITHSYTPTYMGISTETVPIHFLVAINQFVPKRIYVQKSETTFYYSHTKPTPFLNSGRLIWKEGIESENLSWIWKLGSWHFTSVDHISSDVQCVNDNLFYFPSHNSTFLSLIKFAFTFSCSLSGFLKASVLGKLSVISWILLIMCLEMAAGKFASGHVFHYYKSSI